MEVQHLQVVSTIARTYKEVLVDCVNYRGLEAILSELIKKYAEFVKKKTKNAKDIANCFLGVQSYKIRRDKPRIQIQKILQKQSSNDRI